MKSRLFVVVELAFDPPGGAVEDVDDAPEQIFEVGLEAGVLQGGGESVEGVGNGGADEVRPHILMTDLCMPDISGSTLLAMLDGHRTLCKVVISTRVNLTEAVEQKLMALGAAAIFDKQDIARDPRAFLAALRRTAEDQAAGRPPAVDRAFVHGNVIQAAARFPVPQDEVARARTVRTLNIANLNVDPRLNILARHLARLTGYPVAALNVIGADQVWIRAAVGVVPTVVPRGESVCAHAICADGVTAITNLRTDPVLRTSVATTGPLQLRAYIGAPIVARSGVRLGMACVADTRPRCPTQEELNVVADVAELAASALQTPIPQLRSAA